MRNLILIVVFFISNFLFANTELQKLIDNAKPGTPVALEKKTYTITFPIYLKSGIKINGNGAVLIPSKDWKKSNDKYAALLNLVNVNNVEISNMAIDNEGYKSVQNIVYTSVLLLGANNCKIKSIFFNNSGYLPEDKILPESPFILLIAQEKAYDFPYLTKKNSGILSSTSNNIISDCKFINNKTKSAFAIRFITNWTDKKRVFNNLVSGNSISNCTFEGGFDYNTVEIAGGGTVGNVVFNNNFKGKSVNNIDIDKGSSNNIIKENKLLGLGLPERYINNSDVRCSPIMVHGSDSTYLAQNNQVINNTISNISNPTKYNSRYLYSSAIGAAYVENLVIDSNVISSIYDESKYGAGITMDQYVSNVTVTNNKVLNSYWGIIYTPNGKYYKGISISNNQIKSNAEPIMIKRRKDGNYNSSVSKGNIFDNNKSTVIDK